MRSAIRFTLCIAVMTTFGRGLADSTMDRQAAGAANDGDEATTLLSLHQAYENERAVAALAMDRSKSQGVKDVSDRMMGDAKSADAEIRAYARKRHIDLDVLARRATREIDDQLELDRRAHSVGSGMGEYAFSSENDIKSRMEAATPAGKLRRLDGSEFDRAFARNVIADHESQIELLASARAQSSDDLKSLIDRLLPDVQEHLKMVQRLASNP